MKLKNSMLVAVICWCSLVMAQAPDCYEGFGAITKGALDAPGGYDIYHVTSLADDVGETLSGDYQGVEGQLRHACRSASGSRYVVFDVAGTIKLNQPIRIRKPYMTIDGSTAPSPGITVDVGGEAFEVETWSGSKNHDIIINNIRFTGPGNGKGYDILSITADNGKIYNVIIDHCTATTVGDGIDATGDVTNITMSWNFFHHNTLNCLAKYGSVEEPMDGISYHHNVFAKNEERQLNIGENLVTLDFVNNVVYGWDFLGGMKINFIPGTPSPNFNMTNNYYYMWENGFYDLPEHAVTFLRNGASTHVPDANSVYYFSGNIFPVGETDDVSTGSRLTIPAWAEVTTYSASTLGDTVVPYAGTHYPTQAEQTLLNEVSIAIGGNGYPSSPNPTNGQIIMITENEGIPPVDNNFDIKPVMGDTVVLKFREQNPDRTTSFTAIPAPGLAFDVSEPNSLQLSFTTAGLGVKIIEFDAQVIKPYLNKKERFTVSVEAIEVLHPDLLMFVQNGEGD